MQPMMITSSNGRPTPKMILSRSRANSFSSVRASRPRAEPRSAAGSGAIAMDISCFPSLFAVFVFCVAAGQREERVLQAGLVHTQLVGHDLVPGQHGGDRVQRVVVAGDHYDIAP